MKAPVTKEEAKKRVIQFLMNKKLKIDLNGFHSAEAEFGKEIVEIHDNEFTMARQPKRKTIKKTVYEIRS